MTAVLDQRLSALNRANRIRTRRAQLKTELLSGRVKLADVLLAEEDWMYTMKVRDLLLAVPKLGTAKVTRALRATHISPTVALNRTDRRRREALLDWLAVNHPSVELGWERSEVAA